MVATYDTYGAVASGAGGLLQLIGTIQAGIAAKKQAEYNAQIARYNAQVASQAAKTEAEQFHYNAEIAEQDAAMALVAAGFRERQLRTQTARVQGANRATIAASGVTFAGSPMQVLSDNAFQAETEALLIRYGGQLESLAQRHRADLLTYQATLKEGQAGELLTAGEQQAGLSEAKGQEALSGSILRSLGLGIHTVGAYYQRKGATRDDLSVTPDDSPPGVRLW